MAVLHVLQRSFEPELSSFTSPGIPALETVQRKLAATHVDSESADAMENCRARKRPRLMSLGALAETDLMGVLNSAYDSMAASLATSLATSVLPHHIAVASRSDADYKHPHVHGEAPRPRAVSTAASERSVGGDGDGEGEAGDASASGEPTVRKIGAYTVEERKARIARFHRKRKERVWNHKVKYDCRKKLADNRPRYKGRFVRRCDIEKHNAMLAAQAAAAAAAKAAAAGGEAATGNDGATGAGAASATVKPAVGATTRASSVSSKSPGIGSLASAGVAPAVTSS